MPAPDNLGRREDRPIVRLLWLAPLAFAAQIIVMGFVNEPLIRPLLPLSQILLGPFLLANWSYIGVRLVFLGLLMNLLVICLNGGLMPIAPSTLDAVGRQQSADLTLGAHIPNSKNILLSPEDTHLHALSDAIVTPGPKTVSYAISIGDIVAGLGGLLAIAEVLRRARPRSDRITTTQTAATVT